MAITTIKLIGGLLDGQAKEITDMDQRRGYLLLRVPILTQALPKTPQDWGRGPIPIQVKDAAYRRFTICDVEVWAAERLRPPQVIELLLERYARP